MPINSTSNSITLLIEKLSKLAPELEQELQSGDSEQHLPVTVQALQLTRQLAAILSHPADTAVELAYAPLVTVAARIAIDLGLFELISHGQESITSTELACKSGGRILQLLASVGIVQEAGERKWSPTKVTDVMARKDIAAGHRMVAEMLIEPGQKVPKYFQKHGYKCPADIRQGIMQFAFQSTKTSFEILQSSPSISRDFDLFMGKNMGARSYWFDWYPVQENLVQGAREDAAFLVDVGGGKGHDLLAFHNKFPMAGKLVLQDLSCVTETVRDSIDPAIEVMTCDFFSHQPVQGARAYFCHQVMHDWPDAECLKILSILRQAMEPGYSKLLIHDIIMPEQGALAFQGIMDLAMMIFNGGMQRSEKQWHELLTRAGLQVVRFWPPRQGDLQGLVEATVKESH